jgi:TDG/mug DNA glycosylase family protein
MSPSDSTMPAEIKRSFAPVVDVNTRILVLGSLPGEASLRAAQYYANPRNQFWRLMEPVVAAPLAALPYEARLATLLSAGVGLWDVIRSASRSGSLDADIRNHQPNALVELVATLPSLRAVAFNGGKASALGRQLLGDTRALTLVSLPSSSPAHTAPFDSKRLKWSELGRLLGGT